MYTELLFFPHQMREEKIYPEDARKIVAKACDGITIHPGMFARDANGKPLQTRVGDDRQPQGGGAAPSPIVFDAGTGFIRLYGLGKSGVEILNESAMTLMSALQKSIGLCRMEVREGDLTVKMGQPTMYVMRRLVMSKKTRGNPDKESSRDRSRNRINHADRYSSKTPYIQDYFGKSATDCEEAIRLEIMRSIATTAQWMDEELENFGQDTLLGQLPLHKDSTWDLDVLEGESVPIEIKPGIKAAAFKNVTFCTNLEMDGPWAAGKLRSRGYGLIRRRIF